MCNVMELSAIEIMPTVKIINRLIFTPSSSVTACMLASARPRDFAVLLKNSFSVPPLRLGIKCLERPVWQRDRFLNCVE